MSFKKDEKKKFRVLFIEALHKQLEDELGHKVEMDPLKRNKIEELANKQLDERDNHTIKFDELARDGGVFLVGDPSMKKIRLQSALIMAELNALFGDEDEEE